MAAELDFPQTPKGTLAELWSAVIALLPQLGRRLVVRRDYAIATTETPVAHGLPFAPQVGSRFRRPTSPYGNRGAPTPGASTSSLPARRQ
jgi:hypothetical protein